MGPRQCGKTTLARMVVPADSLNYFDLEDPASLARLTEPETALRTLRGIVIIDEIQRRQSCSHCCESWRIANHFPKEGRRVGVECERMDAPTMTPSMRIAMNDLKLDRLVVAYPGERRYALTAGVEVIPLAEPATSGSDAKRLFKKQRR